ncbi:hypothetical protein LRY65_01630 [Candidatus Woesebacteria bacterium]|nr:hypothetical protein [Candidatus Woesebacteria bacterium]MCD8507134.1 hypothetical protein [Candidatus Woesebacteria bacterium]MCD8526892.1 hypothetical protein [Candidatus Woesebacteria bacterium]MCD8546043.1 hypothetical protein [Candidatus Woesebacteria bacterium]
MRSTRQYQRQFEHRRQRTERFLQKKIFTDAPHPSALDTFLEKFTAEVPAESQGITAAIEWFQTQPQAHHYFSRVNPSQEEWKASLMRLGMSMAQAYVLVGIISTALYAQQA